MDVILSYEEYEKFLAASCNLPSLLEQVSVLSAQLDALRTQYVECLERLAELQRFL